MCDDPLALDVDDLRGQPRPAGYGSVDFRCRLCGVGYSGFDNHPHSDCPTFWKIYAWKIVNLAPKAPWVVSDPFEYHWFKLD